VAVKNRERFKEGILKLRRERKLHSSVEARLKTVLKRNFDDSRVIEERYGTTLGRADLSWFMVGGCEVHFELFASRSTVLRDLNLLHESTADVRVAILMDEFLDESVHREYLRRVRVDRYPILNLSDVMLEGREKKLIEDIRKIVERAKTELLNWATLMRLCKKQRKDEIRMYVGSKYREELYAHREVEHFLQSYLVSHKALIILIGRSGTGKTNLLAHFAEKCGERFPTVFISGKRTIRSEYDIENHIVSLLGFDAAKRRQFYDRTETLLKEERSKLLVVIDGVNENSDPRRMKDALKNFISRFAGRNVKVCVSCRDTSWRFFSDDFWSNYGFSTVDAERERHDRLREGREEIIGERVDERFGNQIEEGDVLTFLGAFTEKEFNVAWRRYSREFEVRGELVGNAAKMCRNPLLLRFFCEAHAGENVGRLENIPRRRVLDDYWTKKTKSVMERVGSISKEPIYRLVADMGIEMFRTKSLSIHTTRVMKLMGLHPSEFYDDSSIYRKILDEGVMIQEDVLRTGETVVRFTYEPFMEYVIGYCLVEEEIMGKELADIENCFHSLVAQLSEFPNIVGILESMVVITERRNRQIFHLLATLIARDETIETDDKLKMLSQIELLDQYVFDLLTSYLIPFLGSSKTMSRGHRPIRPAGFGLTPSPLLAEQFMMIRVSSPSFEVVTDTDVLVSRPSSLNLWVSPFDALVNLIVRSCRTRGDFRNYVSYFLTRPEEKLRHVGSSILAELMNEGWDLHRMKKWIVDDICEPEVIAEGVEGEMNCEDFRKALMRIAIDFVNTGSFDEETIDQLLGKSTVFAVRPQFSFTMSMRTGGRDIFRFPRYIAGMCSSSNYGSRLRKRFPEIEVSLFMEGMNFRERVGLLLAKQYDSLSRGLKKTIKEIIEQHLTDNPSVGEFLSLFRIDLVWENLATMLLDFDEELVCGALISNSKVNACFDVPFHSVIYENVLERDLDVFHPLTFVDHSIWRRFVECNLWVNSHCYVGLTNDQQQELVRLKDTFDMDHVEQCPSNLSSIRFRPCIVRVKRESTQKK
jgi:hypothetical protein